MMTVCVGISSVMLSDSESEKPKLLMAVTFNMPPKDYVAVTILDTKLEDSNARLKKES